MTYPTEERFAKETKAVMMTSPMRTPLWNGGSQRLLCGKAVRLNIVGQSSKPCSPMAMPFTPTRPPAENTAEKQRVRQQMLARNWHDDAISPELGSFCQKSHLIAGLIDLS